MRIYIYWLILIIFYNAIINTGTNRTNDSDMSWWNDVNLEDLVELPTVSTNISLSDLVNEFKSHQKYQKTTSLTPQQIETKFKGKTDHIWSQIEDGKIPNGICTKIWNELMKRKDAENYPFNCHGHMLVVYKHQPVVKLLDGKIYKADFLICLCQYRTARRSSKTITFHVIEHFNMEYFILLKIYHKQNIFKLIDFVKLK